MKTRQYFPFSSIPLIILATLGFGHPLCAQDTNHAPRVHLVTPTNHSVFIAPSNIFVSAEGGDPDAGDSVAKVQFFVGDRSLGVVSNRNEAGLFALVWSNAAPGMYMLAAKATDQHGLAAWSLPVSIAVFGPDPTNHPPKVHIVAPTNHSTFIGPLDLRLIAEAGDPDTGDAVTKVQFFAGDHSLGVVSNRNEAGLFALIWSNAPPGNYLLSAKATDNHGANGWSDRVSIAILGSTPTNHPPKVHIIAPTNHSTFIGPLDLRLTAEGGDPDAGDAVVKVQFFAGDHSLGVVSNRNDAGLFVLIWSNAPPGNYLLSAKATDNQGANGWSDPVTISILEGPLTNHPPRVHIFAPTNNTTFIAPVDVRIAAEAGDPDAGDSVAQVQFFAGDHSLGVVSNRTDTGAFVLIWSNAPPGNYLLQAKATDNQGANGWSDRVSIAILGANPPPTNSPVVTIFAIDAIAAEGTNSWHWWTNHPPRDSLTNNAIFRVHRSGNTNADLTVSYSIGGTASNGVDYVELPGVVTIPAGHRSARIVVMPLDDTIPEPIETVILKLQPSPLDPPAYVVGRTHWAAAIIVDNDQPQPLTRMLDDGSFHLQAPGLNGAGFVIESSSDMLHWTPVLTNIVTEGAIHFVDPDAPAAANKFYRAVVQPIPIEANLSAD